jgi:Ca2+:H+ antiporter
MKFREQRFNKTAARTSTTTLTLAAIALAIPMVFHVTAAGHAGAWSQATERKLSLAIAVVLFVTYACLLGFELVTYKQVYIGDSQHDGEGQKETCRWSVSKSLFVLIVATSLVALMSEFLVGAVEAA